MTFYAEDAIGQARDLARRGEANQARQLYKTILQTYPDNVQAREDLAALDIRSAKFNALSALLQKGEFALAVEQGEALFREYPDTVFLCNLLGIAHASLHQADPAIRYFKQALAIRPDIAETHANLGKILSEAGRREEAVASFGRALRFKPGYADAHFSLGTVLRALGRDDEAIASFARALEINPDFAQAHGGLGAALRDAGRYDEAIAHFTRSAEINPRAAGTHVNLGIVYGRLRDFPRAIAALGEALRLNPDLNDARAQKLFLQRTICDWDALPGDEAAIATLGLSGAAVQPFTMLPLEDNPERHRKRSELFARERYGQRELAPIVPPPRRQERLRIGYFSADIHNHAVMYQIVRLLELHDRARFEVHAYSFGPPADDAMRARVAKAVDAFHDVGALGARQIAERARAERIDIAIDLNGYTRNARTEIFARRAAPVQISYLGYPGTLGASFMDYLIADRILIPAELRRHYAEKIIYLPDSHMATDNSKQIPARPITRSQMGLPEKGFVFCCFNNSYKISPAEFDVWMRLLRRIEGSVLWLTGANPWARQNLAIQARKRGIDPARLVFAERVPMPDYLARHRLADLFLDTFDYTGHSTAADALWAGLPLVTRLGQGFAARVGAGLLNAIGLGELVAHSTEDYERLALALAENPQRLAALKAALWERRTTAPLFDSERFTRHVEEAYRQAYDRWFAGRPPDDIAVLAN